MFHFLWIIRPINIDMLNIHIITSLKSFIKPFYDFKIMNGEFF